MVCMLHVVFISTQRKCVSFLLESLHYDGVQQGHVFGPSDWQLVCSVVVDDLWDGEEWRAVLPKHKTPIWKKSEFHVHEAFAAPGGKRKRGKMEESVHLDKLA